MTITLDIRPDIEAELSRRARAQGVDIGAYAAGLLEEAASHLSSSPASGSTGAETRDMVELSG